MRLKWHAIYTHLQTIMRLSFFGNDLVHLHISPVDFVNIKWRQEALQIYQNRALPLNIFKALA